MSKLEPTRTYSNHTATEVLRRLLDERGVEWDYGIMGPTTTKFSVNRIDLTFTPMRDGLMCSTILTPEQAIAATLGATDARPTQVESSGTCTVEGFDDGIDEALDGSPIYTTPTWYLSCGHTCEGAERPSFCKNCGRKVVSE